MRGARTVDCTSIVRAAPNIIMHAMSARSAYWSLYMGVCDIALLIERKSALLVEQDFCTPLKTRLLGSIMIMMSFGGREGGGQKLGWDILVCDILS